MQLVSEGTTTTIEPTVADISFDQSSSYNKPAPVAETSSAELHSHLDRVPIAEARVQIYTELITMVETQLQECSTIEWEERIFFHTVMYNKIGLEKELKNLSTQEQLNQNQQLNQPGLANGTQTPTHQSQVTM